MPTIIRKNFQDILYHVEMPIKNDNKYRAARELRVRARIYNTLLCGRRVCALRAHCVWIYKYSAQATVSRDRKSTHQSLGLSRSDGSGRCGAATSGSDASRQGHVLRVRAHVPSHVTPIPLYAAGTHRTTHPVELQPSGDAAPTSVFRDALHDERTLCTRSETQPCT